MRVGKLSGLVVAAALVGAAQPASALEPRVERQGNKTTYRIGNDAFDELALTATGALSDTVRADVLAGEYKTLPEMSCDKMFDVFLEQVLGDFPDQDLDVLGIAVCFSEEGDDRATEFMYAYAFEPKTDAGIPVQAAYVAGHDGQEVLGEVIRFRRAFGVLVEAALQFFSLTSDSDGEEIDSFPPPRQVYFNRKQAAMWSQKARQAIEGEPIADLVDWIRGEAGDFAAEYYEMSVLPKANFVIGFSNQTLVLEDRTMIPFFGAFLGGRDCRESPNGRCL